MVGSPASQAAIPLWQNILSIVGVSSLISTVMAYRLSSRSERVRWVNDNKKAEWRELIDQLDKSIATMHYAFDRLNVIHGEDSSHDPMIGIANGNRVIQNRIFILETLRKSGMVEEWSKLGQYISEASNPRELTQRGGLPTATGFGLRANTFKDKMLRVARKDLGL
jgi:hypothetical protein